MAGIYVHIPYCIQRCKYCDFSTYVQGEVEPPETYIDQLNEEIRLKTSLFDKQDLTSIYFGGGTPSLLTPSNMVSIINAIGKTHFNINASTEITMEINPATIQKNDLKDFIDMGFNRFSVGAQTFNDRHLKYIGREHNSRQTLDTLSILQEHDLNYSFDLLYALPNQTFKELEADLHILSQQNPRHISGYCLTVPEKHPMSINRPTDQMQTDMFYLVKDFLGDLGLNAYEISNFAKEGFESKHNLLYWTNQFYLGFGLSAHSYAPTKDSFGNRFWNPSSMNEYLKFIRELSEEKLASQFFSEPLSEKLDEDQLLFDFIHTALRLSEGWNPKDTPSAISRYKVKEKISILASERLKELVHRDSQSCWRLTRKGEVLSNQVFSALY